MTKPSKEVTAARKDKLLEPSRQTLYRMFNSNKELLYVGITNNPFGRLTGHSGDKDWFHEIAYATFQHYPNRYEVDKAETNAIKLEAPKYNRAKNPRHEGAIDHYRKLKNAVSNGRFIPAKHEAIVKVGKMITQADSTIKPSAALLLAMKGKTADCLLCQEIEKNRSLNGMRQQTNEQINRRLGYN